MRKVIVGAALAAVALVGSGGAAFAGEITGRVGNTDPRRGE